MRRNHAIALFTTAGKMTSQQLLFTLNRKVRSTAYQKLPISWDDYYSNQVDCKDFELSPIGQSLIPIRSSLTDSDQRYFLEQVTSLQEGEVRFLNRSVESDGELPFLVDPLVGMRRGFPRLWTLKLLSFEPASWIALTSSENEKMIASTMMWWLESWLNQEVTSIGSQNCLRRYWTPFAVSRRIGNLAMLGGILSESTDAKCEALCRHIAKNVQFLRHHVEYDIGGNHLLENACALIIGGVVVDDDDIISRGISILRSELRTQLLDDGMHFERSPMYHTTLLFRIAWSLDILRRTGRTFPLDIKSHIYSMYKFLQLSAPGNVNYPLLNDSVYRESPSRQSCLSLVENLYGIGDNIESSDLINNSGYYKVESGDLMAIVDGGIHCPKHLPAHAHNDLGNIVLWADERPVITDTGTFDYQPGERREYARSVEAHNTIQIDDYDQSVTHGRFMMGPRPKPEARYLDQASKQGIALHYCSPRFVRGYTHERHVEPLLEGIRIDDWVSANESTVTSRLHLSPETEPELNENTVKVTLANDSAVEITVEGTDLIDLNETEHYPEYGVVTMQPTIQAKRVLENEAAHITHEIIYDGLTNDV